MALLDILEQLPLLSAATWFALSFVQVYRDRVHTWTEAFFLAACVSAGLYGVGDWLLFNATTATQAYLAALVGLTWIALTVLFLLLFTVVYVERMRRRVWLLLGPTAVVLFLTWWTGVTRIRPPIGDGLFLPEFNPAVFLVLLLYILTYSLGGIVNLYRVHRIVKASSPALAGRTRGLIAIFVGVLLLGLLTNGYLGATANQDIPPPFSSLLIFVAGATIYTLYPGSRQRVSEVVRRFQARYYDVKGAFVIYRDGTLIGSETAPGEEIIDQDLFSATLDVIQNFMRTSFPTLRGSWLRTITHGEYTLVLERGRYTYIVLVIHGQENDQLRRLMRDQLIAFEGDNQSVLANWRGVPAEAKGTSSMLLSLLED